MYNSSADQFDKGFVPAYFPVPKSPSSQYPFCSKQESAVSETFRSNQGAGSFQPAQLSSPFSCADTSTFVPVDVQVEPNDKNGSYQEYAAYEHSDLSAETASSMERALYADTKPQAEEKNKKKVGRPIAYKGDPNAANLTEGDKRRIKRRIANRESARRVRARRQETLEELQVRMHHITGHNAHMVKHIADVEGHSMLIKDKLQESEVHWNRALADNTSLHHHIALLTARLEAQKAAPVVPKPEQRAADVTAPQFDPMHRTSSFPTAPVTGISRSLIDELPTMALPMPEMLSESFDQDFPDYLN